MPGALWRRLALAWLGLAAAGAQANLPEQDLKAQILVRTLMFAQWPQNLLPPSEALVVCLADDHPMAPAIARQDGQMINGHKLQLRRTTTDPNQQCHVAVVGPGTRPAGQQRRRGLLLVGDLMGGPGEGVALNVQIELGRVVFDVNLKTAREDGLDFDVRLLRLARYVQRD
jgi:hypothetical protein